MSLLSGGASLCSGTQSAARKPQSRSFTTVWKLHRGLADKSLRADMVLDDVTEYEGRGDSRKVTKLKQTLLNGANICLVSMLRRY